MRQINATTLLALRVLGLVTLTVSILSFGRGHLSTLSSYRQEVIDHEADALKRCDSLLHTMSNCIVLYTKRRKLSERRQVNLHHKLLDTSASGNIALPAVYINVARFVHSDQPRTQPEAIFFALTTSTDRIMDLNSVFHTWAPRSGIHFLLTIAVHDPADAEQKAIEFLSGLGLSSYHVQRSSTEFYGDSWSNSLPRMVKIARDMRLRISHYVLMDDDTMITSLVNFRHMLDEHDPDIERVIGSPSEIIQQASAETNGGSGGYGGAGIVLTRSLAENVARSWKDSALVRYNHRAGDCMLSGAIGFVQGRPMASPNIYYERALHQNDVLNPASSLLKGGFRWLTIHHWKWFDVYPGVSKLEQLQRVNELVKMIDAENLFQNHLLRQNENETVILTNGLCITTYSPPLTDRELYQIEAIDPGENEGRFSISNFPATHGPQRPSREEGLDKHTLWYADITSDSADTKAYSMHYQGMGTDKDIYVQWVVS